MAAAGTGLTFPRFPNTFPIDRFPTSYVAFDLETTGLNVSKAGIVEIGAVKVVGGREVDEFQTLVATDVRIEPKASEVSGITKDTLKGAPPTREALGRFAAFVGDMPLVGYNSDGFDMPLLLANAARCGAKVPATGSCDVMDVAKWVFGRRVKLTDMCSALGVEPGGHRALGDARAAHRCLEAARVLIRSTTERSAVFGEPTDGPLSGVCVCFTGRAPGISRHDLMEQAHSLGASLGDRVTLKTTHLVTMPEAGEAKASKAEEYAPRTGVVTVGLAEWEEGVIAPAGGTVLEPVEESAPPAETVTAVAHDGQKKPVPWIKVALVAAAAVAVLAFVAAYWQTIVGLALLAAIVYLVFIKKKR